MTPGIQWTRTGGNTWRFTARWSKLDSYYYNVAKLTVNGNQWIKNEENEWNAWKEQSTVTSEADKPKGCPILLMDQILQWLIIFFANKISQPLIDMNCIESIPIQTIGPLQEFVCLSSPANQHAAFFYLGKNLRYSPWSHLVRPRWCFSSRQSGVDGPMKIDQVLTSSRISGSTLFCSEVRRSTTSAQCPESKRSSSWTNRSTPDHGCGLHYTLRMRMDSTDSRCGCGEAWLWIH